MLSRKHTIFCGNSNLNVQNVNSSNKVLWFMTSPRAGRWLYSSGGSGLKIKERKNELRNKEDLIYFSRCANYDALLTRE